MCSSVIFQLARRDESRRAQPWGWGPTALNNALIPKLFVDQGRKDFQWLSAGEDTTVDEEGGRGSDAELASVPELFLHGILNFLGLNALVEKLGVKPELVSELLISLGAHRALVLENLVVKLPEFPLSVSALGRFRCWGRLGMIGQWEIPVHQSNLVAVLFFDRFERRTDACAVRSLKVGVLDDGYASIHWSFAWFVVSNFKRDPRRIKKNTDLRLCP